MSGTFEEQKVVLIKQLEELEASFNVFTKNVSPRFWRSTGSHFHGIREMIKDVLRYEELSEEERNNPIIQELLKES